MSTTRSSAVSRTGGTLRRAADTLRAAGPRSGRHP
jgi:hypothetical protein